MSLIAEVYFMPLRSPATVAVYVAMGIIWNLEIIIQVQRYEVPPICGTHN